MRDFQASDITLTGQQHWPEVFPLIYQAQGRAEDFSVAEQWLRENHSQLLERLSQHGAILLRGFPIGDAVQFDRVVRAFGLDNFAYAGSLSNAVRTNVTERVFTANEAPAEVAIYLHHEMAQTPCFPSRLFFYCEQAAASGGATPLCRSDVLLTRLEAQLPEFVDRCARLGVCYTNVMPADADAASGQGRSWRDTLGVADRRAAEAKLAGLGYQWQWLAEDNLQVTTPPLAAVRRLSDGRRVFFNQIIAATRGWQDRRNEANKAVRFGNGDSLDIEQLAILWELSDSLSFDLDWKTGDVALVDNFLVMHGRRPFGGRRRVLASLTQRQAHG